VCQQRHEVVYEKSDGACTSSQKITISSHRKASAEPDGIFRQKLLEDYVTKEHCEVWLLPLWSAFVLFERARGGGVGGGGGPGHVSMAKWARFCIPNRHRRFRVARSTAGRCEVYAFRGLSRVGTDPLGGLKIAKASAEVPGPCTECCRTKPRNFVATIALVDHSRTVLTS
jgi:hypothetical protein